MLNDLSAAVGQEPQYTAEEWAAWWGQGGGAVTEAVAGEAAEEPAEEPALGTAVEAGAVEEEEEEDEGRQGGLDDAAVGAALAAGAEEEEDRAFLRTSVPHHPRGVWCCQPAPELQAATFLASLPPLPPGGSTGN